MSLVDRGNHRIQKFTSSGVFITKWSSIGEGDGQFSAPWGVAADAAGNIFVGDYGNQRIQKFTSTGTFLGKWGSYGSGDGWFINPAGVATDTSGNVYVAEGGYRVQKFTSSGAYLTKFGSHGNGDGQLDTAFGVAVDTAGNVHVFDQGNSRIVVFGSGGGPAAHTCNGLPATHIGSARSDQLVGTIAGDQIIGLAANDLLDGGEGADSLCGGADGDILIGGPGIDFLDGGDGTDICVDDGQDTLVNCETEAAEAETAIPGEVVDVELLPTTPGDSGVAATLSNTGGGGNATVTVATYADNPTGVEITAVGDSYVDLNLIGVDATDVVNALLYHPSTVTGVQEASLELLYFDGSEWVHVLSSGGQEPFKNTGDNLDGTVSGGRWSVTFNTSSTPGITALGGTVFTFVTSASVDTDSDGVPDIIDNCARSANPNQADSDNDGKGNTCDADGLVPAACAAISIDNVILGASGNDTLTGTTFNDLVLAMSGNDTVTGNGGDDCVDSGNGNDTVTTRQRRHHRHRRQRQH